MRITEVRVKLSDECDPHEKLMGFASVVFDEAFCVREMRIIEVDGRLVVAMPSRKLADPCPSCRVKNFLMAQYCNRCGQRLGRGRAKLDDNGRPVLYADTAHPINAETRAIITQAVIDAYLDELDARDGRATIPIREAGRSLAS